MARDLLAPRLAVDGSSWSALVVDEDPGVRQSLRLCLETDGAHVLGVGNLEAGRAALSRAAFDIVFLGLRQVDESGLDAIADVVRQQPEVCVVVVAESATLHSAVEATKQGAFDCLQKPLSPAELRHAARRALESLRIRRESAESKDRPEDEEADGNLFQSENVQVRRLLLQATRAAGTELPLLLQGESGTGKNVMARWVWRRSSRAQDPFVRVNCPALSVELMNATLFGDKRGAFTGPTDDACGKVQHAEGGILFLDEVADLSPEAQARLLRFLNDCSYERVGETKERVADVRIIAATNKALDEEVRGGRFREDLFYRLNVISLRLPPLRDRPEDLHALCEHYLSRARGRQQRGAVGFSEAAWQAIRSYSWPGNLRELRNAIERALILCPGNQIEPSDLDIPGEASGTARGPLESNVRLGADVTVDDLEREHIARVLSRAPTLEVAARTLGIDATTLHRKRKRYRLV